MDRKFKLPSTTFIGGNEKFLTLRFVPDILNFYSLLKKKHFYLIQGNFRSIGKCLL